MLENKKKVFSREILQISIPFLESHIYVLNLI